MLIGCYYVVISYGSACITVILTHSENEQSLSHEMHAYMLQVKFDLGYFCFNLGQNEIPLPSHL